MNAQKHGKIVLCAPIHTCGSHTDQFGVGDISLSSRDEITGHAIDIGHILFADPTEDQRLDADTTPTFSENGAKASNVNRRLSRLQADYLTAMFCAFINDELRGVIPSDDEIKSRIGV